MGVKRKKQARPRFEHECRNGHARTPENTYVQPSGKRQCMDCPGFRRKNLSAGQRRGPAPEHYDRLLTDEQLDYLKSLIPCVGCGAAFGTAHRWSCEVPFNVEDDGTAEPSPKNVRAA